MLAKGLAPKSVRNTMTFLHSVFALAVRKGWASANPVQDAARPRRRRASDADPDLQFLSPAELDRVIEAIPDHVVDRDARGPALRLLVLMAGMTGLRQSELLGLRWRDVDFGAQRVRVRNAWVRGEHSGEGKSDLSTRRSVPMTDRLATALKAWRLRTVYGEADDLVFAHPELGTPMDRTKVTRRFKRACRDAGVRQIRFHDLRHTFATTLAAVRPASREPDVHARLTPLRARLHDRHQQQALLWLGRDLRRRHRRRRDDRPTRSPRRDRRPQRRLLPPQRPRPHPPRQRLTAQHAPRFLSHDHSQIKSKGVHFQPAQKGAFSTGLDRSSARGDFHRLRHRVTSRTIVAAYSPVAEAGTRAWRG